MLDWWEEKVNDESTRAERAGLKGCEKNEASDPGKGAPEQLEMSEKPDSYLNRHQIRQVDCAAVNGTAENLGNVSLQLKSLTVQILHYL